MQEDELAMEQAADSEPVVEAESKNHDSDYDSFSDFSSLDEKSESENESYSGSDME